jgi:glutathione S-transferase
MCYHVSHERNVFPQLGIPSDEKVVAHALPKIEVALQVMERQLSHGRGFLLGSEVGLADNYLLPSTYAFGFAPEAKAMYADFPAIREWREKMEAQPTARRLSRRPAAACAHRARPQMGSLAPPEILTR